MFSVKTAIKHTKNLKEKELKQSFIYSEFTDFSMKGITCYLQLIKLVVFEFCGMTDATYKTLLEIL